MVLHASIRKILYIVQKPNSVTIVLFFKILPKPLKEKLIKKTNKKISS